FLASSFQRPEEGVFIHQSFSMPKEASTSDPESLLSRQQLLERQAGDPEVPPKVRAYLKSRMNAKFPIDIRPLSPILPWPPAGQPRPARQMMWMKAVGRLDDSPHIHRC